MRAMLRIAGMTGLRGCEWQISTANSTGRCNTLTTAQAAGVLQIKRRPRIYYSDSQKALTWERWKQGWTLNEIGRLFDRPHTSIQQIVVRTGEPTLFPSSQEPAADVFRKTEGISQILRQFP